MLETRICADKHDVRARHIYTHSKLALDVVLVLGVQADLGLAIAEVEINVLMRLPSLHEAVRMDVGATESDKSAREAHPWGRIRFVARMPRISAIVPATA